ncbi:hypothetical protein RRG08_011547 [Elysia crispata]|uniref:Uncharacterized protein n=1 Tax=Elysia crispata TaxID=231223 RepID=A0AAE0ZT26_9GAST|nr:hypothetical protein RRG08_011547 [Elysia crispata]
MPLSSHAEIFLILYKIEIKGRNGMPVKVFPGVSGQTLEDSMSSLSKALSSDIWCDFQYALPSTACRASSNRSPVCRETLLLVNQSLLDVPEVPGDSVQHTRVRLIWQVGEQLKSYFVAKMTNFGV